jgi:hypothetical protein
LRNYVGDFTSYNVTNYFFNSAILQDETLFSY